jgi:hypothetical protein
LQRGRNGKIPVVPRNDRNGDNGRATKVLLLAARQPELTALLEQAGFAVEAHRRPLADGLPDVDVAIVFRGRLIGRNQAATLAEGGIPVIEVLTAEPASPSTARWVRLSNRIHKSDLVQIVRALADEASGV